MPLFGGWGGRFKTKEPQTKQTGGIINNMCKCPYCFKYFSTEAVLFKAQTVYAEQDLEDLSDAERSQREQYREIDDEAYIRFWKDYPGTKTGFQYERNPIIANGQINPNYPSYIGQTRDADGFLYQVKDAEGKETKIRICPLCHNPLPHQYGKYPVKYIAVVGITSSGKTVYLTQLLAKIQLFLARVGLTTVGRHEESDDFVRQHPIKKDQPLPTGNATDVLTLPIPLNVVNQKTGEKYTLIFYDIAGENCVNPDQMDKYGKFVQNADGIIMIIDPGQLAELIHMSDEDFGENTASPTKVVETMYDAFLSANGKSSIPLAAALSKIDLLWDYYSSENMNMFQEIDYTGYTEVGFPYDDYLNIDTEIRRLLTPSHNGDITQGTLLRNQLRESFPDNHSFFAFSALNTKAVEKTDENGVTYSTLEVDPITTRIEEPLFWVLYKLGLIEKAQKKRP